MRALEDKLAETAPKKPLALTIGAAAVTLVVIIGVLAGPSLATCFNSADGMGVCLRGKMTEAGLLPAPATIVATPAEAPAAPAEAAPVETAIAEPELDVAPSAEPMVVPENLIAATFGLLRAEPDGSVVIAGSGTPGSEVEVYSNGTSLGRATVESSGDWVLVPDQPIPPGGTELTLAEVGKEGQAAESFVVVINDDKTSEPLVVASTPGAASEVLQGLERPAAPDDTIAVAAADPVAPAPAATPQVAPAEPAAPAAEPPAPVATTEPEPEPVAPSAEAVTPEPADAPAEAETPAVATETSEPATPAVAPPAAPAPVEPATPAAQPEPPATEPSAPATEPDMAVAAIDPAADLPVEPEIAPIGVPPTIDAIEIEGERTFFAGGGPEGGTMRLYVDDTYIDDATVTDGRWLVEAGNVLTAPSQRIRVDLLQPNSADVAARAEVDFVVELPATEPPIAVAQAEPPAAPAPDAEPTAPPPAAPEPAAAPAAPEPVASQPDVAEPAPPAPAAGAPVPQTRPPGLGLPAETTPEAPTAVTPADTSASSVDAAPEPVESVVAPEPAPVTADAPTDVAAATPAAEPVEGDVPTMVAVAVGDPEALRFASGKAIIRRGDNLWTIARRVYGAGIKYTTIYEANNQQIRDPDRIYPGQVFDLPTSAN